MLLLLLMMKKLSESCVTKTGEHHSYSKDYTAEGASSNAVTNKNLSFFFSLLFNKNWSCLLQLYAITLLQELRRHFLISPICSHLQPSKMYWLEIHHHFPFLNEDFHWKFGKIPVSIFWVTEAIKLDVFHRHVVSGKILSIFVVKVIGKSSVWA